MKKTVWTDNYLIASYEVDATGMATLPVLCKFMQETAYNHAHHMEFGYEHLKAQNLFWVLSRLAVRIERYPCWGDTIALQTWPTGVERLFAFRDFRILDSSGTPIGAAVSAWLMLDAEKRRPQRPNPLLEDKIDRLPEERALEQRPAKISPLSQPQEGPFFPVRYSDLDLYDHVNNARYIQWILDSYPGAMNREYDVSFFEINFLAETKLGDEAAIHTQALDGSGLTFLHSVKRKSDQKDACLARAAWKKMKSFPGR